MQTTKIRCKICGALNEGVILKHYNLKVCLDCFQNFFKKRVQEIIEKFKMFDKNNDILIAISGGKDSMSITKALKDMGYTITALHINTGVKDISKKSQEIVQIFCKKENIPLKIIEIYAELNASLEELSKVSRRPVCSVCGMLRRYLLNRESNNRIIVTGHTLNDEVSFILKNMLFWNDELLSKTYPVLYEREGLSRKVKPLCLITEEETRYFCKISNIHYIDESCLHKSEVYEVFKNAVKQFNENFPGSIIGFYKGFLNRVGTFYSETDKDVPPQKCQICGYPTTGLVCSFCRLKEKLLQYKHG